MFESIDNKWQELLLVLNHELLNSEVKNLCLNIFLFEPCRLVKLTFGKCTSYFCCNLSLICRRCLRVMQAFDDPMQDQQMGLLSYLNQSQ